MESGVMITIKMADCPQANQSIQVSEQWIVKLCLVCSGMKTLLSVNLLRAVKFASSNNNKKNCILLCQELQKPFNSFSEHKLIAIEFCQNAFILTSQKVSRKSLCFAHPILNHFVSHESVNWNFFHSNQKKGPNNMPCWLLTKLSSNLQSKTTQQGCFAKSWKNDQIAWWNASRKLQRLLSLLQEPAVFEKQIQKCHWKIFAQFLDTDENLSCFGF